jgi:hypothetical protein
MRTGWRAWAVRAAVVGIASTVGVVSLASPAHAARPRVNDFSIAPSSMTLQPGQPLTARFTIRMEDFNPGTASYSATSNRTDRLRCVGGCGAQNAQIPAAGLPVEAEFETVGFFANQEQVTIEVRASNGDGEEALSANITILATPTVPRVAGTVYELLTGKGVPAARIAMTDSVGTRWDNIGTDDNGFFEISQAQQGQPIASGNLVLEITKDGYIHKTFEVNSNSPQVTNLRIPVEVDPAAGSATPTVSAPPITASLDTPGGESPIAQAPGDSGLSTFSLMLIIVGTLLVLLGIAAIVLLFVRRGDGDDDGPPGRGPKGPNGRTGGPPGRGGPPGQRRPGAPDRTGQIRPPYGPPRPGQTTISRSPLADNPTQHGRPGPPPYPPQPPGGYRPPQGPPTQGPPTQGGGYGPQGHGGPPTGYVQPYGGDPRQGDPRQGGPRPRPEGRRVDWTDDY